MTSNTSKVQNVHLSAAARIAAIIIAVAGFVYLTALEVSPPSVSILAEQLRVESRKGNVERVDALLAKGVPIDQADIDGMTALMEASRAGRDPCVEHLLAAGANVNVCASVYSTPLIQATLNRHASTVEILLKHGASPNLRSRLSNSALFWAADLQEPEIIRLLQRYGAKVLKV